MIRWGLGNAHSGGMWVESDQLLPSGESLARQFLYGQRYFYSRFGKYCRTWWLPDSFGYNSASPQIARLAGLDFFFTQKLSWSRESSAPSPPLEPPRERSSSLVTCGQDRR